MGYIKSTFKPYENQKNNIGALVRKRRALLIDKCGTGKTMSVLCAFAVLKQHDKLNNMLVLTPLSAYVKKVWLTDIEKFTTFHAIDLESLYNRIHNFPDKLSFYLKEFPIIYGKQSHIKKYSKLIEMICSSQRVLFCCDEVHFYRNPRSALTIATKLAVRNAYAIWGVTATTLSRNFEDTYNIVNFVCPWFLGSFENFKNTYCLVQDKVIGRLPGGRVRTVQMIVGVKSIEQFSQKLEPLVIKGASYFEPKFHFVDYELSPYEKRIYCRIAKGIDFVTTGQSDDWLRQVLQQEPKDLMPLKEIERYSSRYIYLQSAADGIVSEEGTQDRKGSTKVKILLSLLKTIIDKNESALVYFNYYSALHIVKSAIAECGWRCKVIESSGAVVVADGEIGEAKVKQIPHIVLCTKASSNSVSYYYINHVVFFHIPTVVDTFAQMAGRILRKNTIFDDDDLHIHIFRSNNIDLYNMFVVSNKSFQMELSAGPEASIPPDYKIMATKKDFVQKQKKLLLWDLR